MSNLSGGRALSLSPFLPSFARPHQSILDPHSLDSMAHTIMPASTSVTNGVDKPRPRVTINCDMGEGFGNYKMGPDEELMPLIDLANVACGFHGGSPSIMHQTILLAKRHGVPVGAHPSLPDREGFGRRHIDVSPDDLYAHLVYQIGALTGLLAAQGMALNHIKTHGYLWRLCEASPEHCAAVLRAGRAFPGVPFLVISGTAMEAAMHEAGDVPYVPEFYPDIHYADDGKLMSILRDGRVPLGDIRDKVAMAVTTDTVVAKTTGMPVKLGLEGKEFSCCIHSDLPHPIETLREVRAAIDAAKGL